MHTEKPVKNHGTRKDIATLTDEEKAKLWAAMKALKADTTDKVSLNKHCPETDLLKSYGSILIKTVCSEVIMGIPIFLSIQVLNTSFECFNTYLCNS